MGWNNDPELQELFQGELNERSERLAKGAQAMQQGTVDDELAGAMLREGHTIKGTGRVMGFVAISRAGQLVEQVWRQIQHGDVRPTPAIGEALAAVADALPAAVMADSEAGTPQLDAALSELTQCAQC